VSHGNVLADILVSELLGSWGDNELSPECLDGAQRYLKPSGISVPCDYTSYVAPLSSPKLWNEVRKFKDLTLTLTLTVTLTVTLTLTLTRCATSRTSHTSRRSTSSRYTMPSR